MLGLLSMFSPATVTMSEPLSMSFPTICSAAYTDHRTIRCWNGNEEKKGNGMRRRSLVFARNAQITASASPLSSDQPIEKDLSRSKLYQEIQKAAREKFTQAISFPSKDKDISLAKTLLYVAAEDEAFMASNREIDALSLSKERSSVLSPPEALEWDSLEEMPLAGKTISQWMSELNVIADEVKAELTSKDIGCQMVGVLEVVNLVLFGSRGFKRISVLIDSKCSYLHSALSSRSCTAILLSVIYIEVCRRLDMPILGSRVGEDFLIWPQTGNPEELFKVSSDSGHSLFAIVNGSCVEDPKSRASELTSSSLPGLEIALNKDIIGIALANLIRLHWKRASRLTHGLMLSSPLRSVQRAFEKLNGPLVSPQDLRLAIMAAERMLILQPHNWVLRRDLGMMLYYSREYGEAVQELSICMAFAPQEESEILEPFVEKLHLLRLESSWKSMGYLDQLTTP